VNLPAEDGLSFGFDRVAGRTTFVGLFDAMTNVTVVFDALDRPAPFARLSTNFPRVGIAPNDQNEQPNAMHTRERSALTLLPGCVCAFARNLRASPWVKRIMRILYGVTGCGLGHTMRARALAQHLRDQGHNVTFAASGRAVGILRGHGFDVVAIDGMTMHFERGAVQRTKTLFDLARRTPRALAHNASVALRNVLDASPDVLVTDFDSFTTTVGALLGRPVISVDHQHVMDRFRHPSTVTRTVSSFGLARTLVSAKTPRCAHYVVSSFFFPTPKSGATTLVGPIVRPEIENASPTMGEHVLVYQTTNGDPQLLPALSATPGVRFIVYGFGRDSTIGNVSLRAFDEARFVEDLASCRAVIANGGFTTLSEAIVLGKPVLSIPVRRQPEQELNAAWLQALGLGMRARRIDAPTIQNFLSRFDRHRVPRDARIHRGTADAKSALLRAIQEAA
jgi:uncharacterized protein (TIGR00661 family)